MKAVHLGDKIMLKKYIIVFMIVYVENVRISINQKERASIINLINKIDIYSNN